VSSATRPENPSPTFGAPGRGLGFRFLLVLLLDAMVHIVEHHDFLPEDFMVEEAAASSTPWTTNLPAPGVAAAVHSARQHTPAQTSRTSRAAPGALSAARELLCHPPSSTASPGAMKQWHDDVDCLLGMAHSGSTRWRPLSSRHQHEASASVRSPSVRIAPTKDLRSELNRRRAGEDALVSMERSNDLWAELNRRHAGEDARISLERARECRQNVEGRNLDCDFAAVAPQTPMGARFQVGVPLAVVGCAALADHLRTVTWPSMFRPHRPEKYDGTSNPSEFLQVYVTAITAVGGDTTVMATYFHVALFGPARTWLMNLTPGSIYSWEGLYTRFTANFASAYQQHGMEAHLHAVRQEPGETLRTFISYFTRVRGTNTVSPMLPSSPLSARGCVMKRCWRCWPHMMWKLSPRSSLWPISEPGLPRAVHGTRHHRPGLPRWVARVPSLRTAKRTRRIVAPRRHRLLLWSSQLRLGAETSATSAHGRRGVTVAHALYTPTVAIAPRSVARSSNSRSVSANGASRPPRTAPLLVAGLARKASTAARWLRENRALGISYPRGS
jgi:hypothetical protein